MVEPLQKNLTLPEPDSGVGSVMPSTRDQIMDVAESLLREGGYHGFSFRDVAAAVGVKSASVHHHFPTKEDLVLAVTTRYHAGFMEALGPPGGGKPVPRLRHYGQVFLTAFQETGSTCLCGMLTAESRNLPASVREFTRTTATDNVDWLEEAVVLPGAARRSKTTRGQANSIYCAFEGAIHLAALQGNEQVIRDVMASLERSLSA